jgi:hypothetical protein
MSKVKYIFSKELLIKKYIIEKKSLKKIAIELGCSDVPIKRYMKIYLIPIRTISESRVGLKLSDIHKKNISIAGKKRYENPEEILKLKKMFSGVNNPNYRHGKNLDTYHNYCVDCNKEIDIRTKHCRKCASKYSHPFEGRHHTEKSKKIIGLKSSQKFTKEYLEKVRKTYEKIGNWIPIENVKPYIIYRNLSNWNKKLNSYLNIYRNFFFVRDHKYSRYSGFLHGVYPVILRHPVNCELLTRGENVSKAKNKNKMLDSITLDTLFNLIEKHKGKWVEQNDCLEKIKMYRQGERYAVGGFYE